MPPNTDVVGGAINAFAEWAWKKLVGQATTPRGGIGTVMQLGSGYDVEAERKKNADKLAALCKEAITNKAWQPDGGVTHCNRAVNFIAQGMGYFKFSGLANQMVAHMENSPAWREEADLKRCSKAAEQGALVVYGRQAEPNGHVCVGYPVPMAHSGTWGEAVPSVANVGRENGILKLSQVFRNAERPRAWILTGSEA